MRIIDLLEIRRTLAYPEIIARMRDALIAYFRECDMPMPMHLDIQPERGEVHIKSSYRRCGKYFGVKIASTFPGNVARGLPTGNGMMLLCSAETGEPQALLADAGHLTDVRTAAAAAMVARELKRPDEVVGILGTGVQARLQAQMHAQVLNLVQLWIWGRTPQRVAECKQDLERLLPHVEVFVADSPAEVARRTRLIITCTASREPLLLAEELLPRTLICAVGSDSPGKQELDPGILRRAALILVDSRRQCEKLGELQHAPSERERAVEIGSFCVEEDGLQYWLRQSVLKAWFSKDDGPITVCDFTGLGVEDLYIAEYCYEKEHQLKIDKFEMERMQSTWENVVEMDLSESGVRPVSLRELGEMGLDLDAILSTPLTYSQSNGTIPLRENLAALYPGATPDHIEVTNGTSEANYLLALALVRSGDEVAFEVPNYMQYWGVPKSLGAQVNCFHLRIDQDWEPDWDEFDRAVTARTRLVYLSNPNNPSGAVLTQDAMKRIVERCESTGAYLLADEVYQGAEIHCDRTRSFWGMSDRVIVTSGLSKAYGIPGVRIGWIVGPPDVIAECWTQHDYITICPNKISDAVARVAVHAENREKLYARTRTILQQNLPIMREWVDAFGGFLTFREPKAGALCLMRYHSATPSYPLCERIRVNQSVLIVPGVHLGLEGFLRIWLGGKPEFLSEGLRRIGEELRKEALSD